MRLPAGGAVSGWAALRLWGGGFFDGTRDGHLQLPVDLVVPPTADIRQVPGIVRHRASLGTGDIALRHGVPCTIPTRALVDAIHWEVTPLRRQQMADLSLSADLTTAADIGAYLATRANSRGRLIVDAAIRQSSDRVLSPQETTLRLLWELEAHLPPVRCNWPVADERCRYLGRPDLLCETEAVVVEYDGRDHTRDDVRVVDMTKEDGYRRCGLEYIKVIGRDLAHPDRIITRMHEAVRRSRASRIPRTYQVARNPPPVTSEWGTSAGFRGQIRS